MAKYFQIPFAMNGDKKEIPTDKQDDGSISFDEGYGADYEKNKQVDPTAKDISRQEFNSVLHDITDAVGEIQRSGVATWTNEISYNKGATIIHNGAVYTSTINANKNEPPHASWSSLDLSSYRKLDDLLFNGMMKVQATDDVGTGVFLLDKDGNPRGQITSNSGGLQFAQHDSDGTSRTYTLPKEDGELLVDASLKELEAKATVADILYNTSEKDGAFVRELTVDVVGSTGTSIFQTVAIDYLTNEIYALRSRGKTDGVEFMQLAVYSKDSDTPTLLNPSDDLEHQCFGLYRDANKLYVISGASSKHSARGGKIAISEIVDNGLNTEVIEFKGSDLFREASLNNVTTSASQRFTLIQGVSATTGMLACIVFDTKELIYKKSEADYLYRFNVKREGTRYPQSVAHDDNNTYILYGVDSGGDTNTIEVYNQKGEQLLRDDKNLTGKYITETIAHKYYEPEGVFFDCSRGKPELMMLVAGGKRAGSTSNTPYSNFIINVNNPNPSKITYFDNISIEKFNSNTSLTYRATGGSTTLYLASNSNDIESHVGCRDYSSDNAISLRCTANTYGVWSASISNWLIYYNRTEGLLKINQLLQTRSIQPSADSTYNLGSASNRYSNVYLNNQPNVSSDIKLKSNITSVSDKYLKVIELMEFKQYNIKFDDKVHFGIIAQDWIKACNEAGVDPFESSVLTGSEEDGYAVRYGELQNLFNAYILTKLK